MPRSKSKSDQKEEASIQAQLELAQAQLELARAEVARLKSKPQRAVIKSGVTIIPYTVVSHVFHIMVARRKDKDYDGIYETPGGGIEVGESAIKAAIRELEEEAALGVSPEELLYLGPQACINPRGFAYIQHGFAFDVSPYRAKVTAGWVNVEDCRTNWELKSIDNLMNLSDRTMPSIPVFLDRLFHNLSGSYTRIRGAKKWLEPQALLAMEDLRVL